MRKSKTLLNKTWTLALVLSLAAAGGCGTAGNKDGTAGSSNQPAAGTAAAEPTPAGEVLAAPGLPLDQSGQPSPLGRYAEPVTLKIAQTINPTISFPDGQTATDNAYFDYLKEKMNIDVEVMWQAGSTDDYNEKLNLAISSGELPDVFSVNGPQLKMLVRSGMLEDLTQSYEIYASDQVKQTLDSTDGKAIEAVTDEGRIMALPNVKAMKDGYSLLWIRQDWLDELGLEVPRDIDGIRQTAKAFIDNQMGGEKTIGVLSPSSGSNLYSTFLKSSAAWCGLDGFFQASQAYPGYWIDGDDGNVGYGSLTPQTKQALALLAQMYQEGTLDPEIGTRKDADEAWKSGQAGIFFGPWWVGYNLKDALANDPAADWQAYPYPLTGEGEWSVHMMNASDAFCVVRKGYEHPEILMLMNNYYKQDSSIIDTMGLSTSLLPGGVALSSAKQKQSDAQIINQYLETGTVPEYDQAEHSHMENDLATVKETKLEPYDDLGIAAWDTSHSNFGRIYSTLVGVGAIDQGYEIGAREVYSRLYWQTDGMQRKWSNLQKLEDETFLKIILGAEPIEQFDVFVADWKAQGGDDITKEVNEAVKQ